MIDAIEEAEEENGTVKEKEADRMTIRGLLEVDPQCSHRIRQGSAAWISRTTV